MLTLELPVLFQQEPVKIALKQAGVTPDQLQHLNAHATSTPVGNLGEINAIKHLSAKMALSLLAQPNQLPTICWVLPENWKSFSPPWLCAIKSPPLPWI